MPLVRALVYVSSASHRLRGAELAYLLQRARWRNEREGVTGVLLYADGNFMQFIEGDERGVAAVYRHIRGCSLHRGMIELLRETRPAREFAEWSMAFKGLADSELPANPHEAWLQARLRPGSEPLSPARMLLSAFWNRAERLGESG